jgi:hypothetical protein
VIGFSTLRGETRLRFCRSRLQTRTYQWGEPPRRHSNAVRFIRDPIERRAFRAVRNERGCLHALSEHQVQPVFGRKRLHFVSELRFRTPGHAVDAASLYT